MQNLLSMIQPAMPTEAVNKQFTGQGAGNETLSELFAELLLKFQTMHLEGDTPEQSEVPDEATEATTIPEAVDTPPQENNSGESLALGTLHTIAEVKQMILEKLSELELPDTVDQEHLLEIIVEAFNRGKSPEGQTQLIQPPQVGALHLMNALQNEAATQGIRPAVVAQVRELLAESSEAATQGIRPAVVAQVSELLAESSEAATQGIRPAVVAQVSELLANPSEAPTQGLSPEVVAKLSELLANNVPVKVHTQQDQPTAQGIPPEAVAKLTEVVEQGVRPEMLNKLRALSTNEVKPEAQAPGTEHRPDVSKDAISRSVAPQVLTQLKEAGVKGITDEKIARVEAAISKGVTPEATVASMPLKQTEEAVFMPPKVATLPPEGKVLEQAMSKGASQTTSTPESRVLEPIEAKFTPVNEATPKDIAVPEKGQLNTALPAVDASTEAIPLVKPMVQPSALAMTPVASLPPESVEIQKAPQEAAPKMEAPTVRTVGDFTIRSVRHLLGSGEESIEVRLNPRSLGSLSISVKTTGESVEIIVTAASPMVREMLEVQMVGLKESLMKDGVEVSKVRIESNAPTQNDSTQLASHHHSTSSHGESRQSQSAQRASELYDSDTTDSGESNPAENNPSSHHDGEIDLFV